MIGRKFLAFLLLSAAAATADQDPKEDPEFIGKIEDSIALGVEFLLSTQSSTGKFPAFQDTRGETYELGMHALSTLAVIKGLGDAEAEPSVKALKVLNSLYQRHRATMKTYEAGIVLMVLDAKYNTDPRPKKGQRSPPKKKRRRRVHPKDIQTAKEIVLWLQTKQRPQGLWRYPENGIDMSNSQYAALGLWSAHRLGVEVAPGVVRRMLEETLNRQQPVAKAKRVAFIQDPSLHAGGRKTEDKQRSATSIHARGWRYLPEERYIGVDGKEKTVVYPYSGSMTTAGIAVLAIGRDILGPKDSWLGGGKDAIVRKSMWEGLAWLQDNWDMWDNPGQPGNWPFYWIYGLERAARLCGVDYVGGRDWYLEGAGRLLDDQKSNGAWPKNPRMRPPGDQNVRWWSDQVDTCFAILFLTRSTPEIKTPPPAITPASD